MTDVMTQDAGQLPATTAQTAPRQVSKLDSFMASLANRSDSLSSLLSEAGVDPHRFLAVARRALAKDADLLGCAPASLMQAFINAATDGLVPDGRKAAIVKFKGAAQYMPMVQGLMEIAYRSGQFLNIEARVVYEGDVFDYELGDQPFIKHKPSALAVANRKITHAYAIARTTNGGIFREVLEKPDLDKIAKVSRAEKGPNKDWPEEMARKAPLRRMWKYLPKTPQMERVVEHDDRNYDLTQLNDAAEPARRLAPGFAARLPASPQAADETPRLDDTLDGDDIPDFGAEAEASDAEGGQTASGGESSPGQGPSAQAPDDFPGDAPQTGSTAKSTTGPELTLAQRVAGFDKRLAEAASAVKVKALWANAGQLRKDLERADPEEGVALEERFNDRLAAIEAEEREARDA